MRISLAKRYPYVPAAILIVVAWAFIPLFIIQIPGVLDIRFGLILVCVGGLVASTPVTAVFLILWERYELRRKVRGDLVGHRVGTRD